MELHLVLLDGEAGIISVARVKTLTHVCQADTVSPACRSLRIEVVVDRDSDGGIVRTIVRMQPYPPAFREIGNAMCHGVLDQWLQN